MSDEDWDPAADHEVAVGSTKAEAEAAEAQPRYDSLDAWMDDWFVRVVRRRVGRGSAVWCAQWWAHPEAASRLGALWGAWEQAQVDQGSAPSQWWLWHFDAHWAALTNPGGPFAACSADRHERDPDPLPTTARVTDEELQVAESDIA